MKNKLMLGNYVKFDNRYFKIIGITDEYPFLDTIEFGVGVVTWDNIYPVMITDELLKKLKFYRYYDKDFDWVKVDVKLCRCPDKENYYIPEKDYVEITYLHELQNLFFLFTNEQLMCDGIF